MIKGKGRRALRLALAAGMGLMAAPGIKPVARRLIEARAMGELTKRWGSEAAKRILAAYRREHKALLKDGRKEKRALWFHLFSARQGLALYRALVTELGEGEEAIDGTHEVIWEAFMKPPSLLLGYLLGRCKDPFATYARGVALVDHYVFPATGWDGKVVEVDGGVGFDYASCFYDDYMREKGAPELTRAYCRIDERQSGCFPDQVEFRRTCMLSSGDALCDFRFYRRD